MEYHGIVGPSPTEVSAAAAQCIMADLQAILAHRPMAHVVFATGATPIQTYAHLVQHGNAVAWSRVLVYQLDEYAGLAPDDARRFSAFLQNHLVRPLGPCFRSLSGEESDAAMAAYEAEIVAGGGLDLAVYGVGVNGHLGFNEPGTPFDAPSRRVRLSESTRARISPQEGQVPVEAVTLGLRVMNRAHRIRVLAFGSAKCDALARGLLNPPNPAVPLSSIQAHQDVRYFIDSAAAPAGLRLRA